MSEPKSFFTDSATAAIFRGLIAQLPTGRAGAATPEFSDLLKVHTSTMLSIFLSNPAVIDKSCSQNIEWIGDHFKSASGAYSIGDINEKAQLEDIFSCGYRFMCELEFN